MTLSDQDWDKFRKALKATSPQVPKVNLVSAVMAEIEQPARSPFPALFRWVTLSATTFAVLAIGFTFWLERPIVSVADLLREAAPQEARWVMNGTHSIEDILISSYYGGE